MTGFMGTGKTAVGKELAARLGFEFEDTDAQIEKEAGCSVSQIFRGKGEPYFRRLERRMVRRLKGRKEMVLATGGGMVLDPGNIRQLRKSGWLIGLTAKPHTVVKRLAEHRDRPILEKPNRLAEVRRLLGRRRSFYERADCLISTDGLSVGEVVDRIQDWLLARLNCTVPVRVAPNPYTIEIGWDILKDLGTRLAGLGMGRKVAVVTNPLIGRLYGGVTLRSLKKAGFQPLYVQIPDGERYKTIRWVNFIYDELLKHRFERSSCLLALGGGVIGDMTGFAAATYLRGIPYVQIPTTLAAQVDSSIGGKTGVNHPRGKNLIGAFHQPRLVYTDIKTLETLDRRNFVSGLAEVIKYGVIADGAFFGYLEAQLPRILERNPHYLLPAVKRSGEIKAEVVWKDEREGGLRRILNYGHTLGHALEAATHYRKYLHGEAISVGMSFAARLSLSLGLCKAESVERQERLLVRSGLPIAFPKIGQRAVLDAMAHDKKVRGGAIYFVLAGPIGRVSVRPVPAGKIQAQLRAFASGRRRRFGRK